MTRSTRQHRAIIAALATLLVASPVTQASELDPLMNYTGEQLFGRFCASCHGIQGRGDGPVAPSLKVLVPDLAELARRSGGRFPEERVRNVIDGRAVLPVHGTRAMPVWGYELEAQAPADQPGREAAQNLISRLVEHVSTLQRD